MRSKSGKRAARRGTGESPFGQSTTNEPMNDEQAMGTHHSEPAEVYDRGGAGGARGQSWDTVHEFDDVEHGTDARRGESVEHVERDPQLNDETENRE